MQCFFNGNTSVDMKEGVCSILNIMTESLNDNYLGLPAMVGANRSDCFKHLVDRVLAKTKVWKEKMLSMGGKEILLKSIAQVVPVYAMMVFNIPKKMCVKVLLMPLRSSGGVMMMSKRGCIGWLGGNFVFRKVEEVWDFAISIVSI